jgi:hypothetical protein
LEPPLCVLCGLQPGHCEHCPGNYGACVCPSGCGRTTATRCFLKHPHLIENRVQGLPVGRCCDLCQSMLIDGDTYFACVGCKYAECVACYK